MNAHRADLRRQQIQSLLGYLSLPFSERKVLLVTVDLLLINLSILGGLWLWRTSDVAGSVRELMAITLASHWWWMPILSLTWLALGWALDLYDINLSSRRLAMLPYLGLAMATLIGGYLVLYFIAPVQSLPRLLFVYFALTVTLSLGLWRWVYATVFALPQLQRRVLIVGAGWAGRTCAELMTEHGDKLYRALGFVDDNPTKQGMLVTGLPVLGDSDHLLSLAKQYHIDKIVVAITGSMLGKLFQTLIDCRARGLTVVRLPELYEALTRQVPVDHVDMSWVLDATDDFNSAERLQHMFRRLLDLAGACLGLAILGCVLPVVALAIALDDSGPIFYRQIRAGKAGRPIELIKFRTMRTDAEEDGTAQWAREHDDRITRVGRFLRKTRLDELPQVINILRGDMHLVGPRPERPDFIKELEQQIPFYRTRLIVRPGLTGWAQIHHGYGNSIEDARIKLQYDLYYIRHRSLRMDLYVILKTVGVVLRMGGL